MSLTDDRQSSWKGWIEAMDNLLVYKGFSARIEFDARDNIFFGRILGIEDLVTFHGESVSDLREAFQEAVIDYLESCKAVVI